MESTKTMKEYGWVKKWIGRKVLLESFLDGEEFSALEFAEKFYAVQNEIDIIVRTPRRPNSRSGAWGFLDWPDRWNRFLKGYCDHVGRGKWRVNLTKKAWNLKGGERNAKSKKM